MYDKGTRYGMCSPLRYRFYQLGQHPLSSLLNSEVSFTYLPVQNVKKNNTGLASKRRNVGLLNSIDTFDRIRMIIGSDVFPIFFGSDYITVTFRLKGESEHRAPLYHGNSMGIHGSQCQDTHMSFPLLT